MKHYFEFRDGAWDTVNVVAPLNGTVRAVREEWAGTQLEIESTARPGLNIVLFHIDVREYCRAQYNELDTIALLVRCGCALQRQGSSFYEGDQLAAGDLLGKHVGAQTDSDIAVRLVHNEPWTLVSVFDIMSDKVFSKFQQYGIHSR